MWVYRDWGPSGDQGDIEKVSLVLVKFGTDDRIVRKQSVLVHGYYFYEVNDVGQWQQASGSKSCTLFSEG